MPKHSMTLAQLMERDDYKCHICGNKVELEHASRDHLIPRSRGGTNHHANIALAHKKCNKDKRNKIDPEWLMESPFVWNGTTRKWVVKKRADASKKMRGMPGRNGEGGTGN